MKGFRSNVFNLFTRLLPVTLAIAGAGLLTYSIFLIYVPAGLAVGAVLLLAAAYDSSR